MARFRFKWWALLGLSVLAFTAFLDFTIVNTALPFIQQALNASILRLQWISNIFAIVVSMSMVAVGRLADRWGKTKIFYIGIGCFGIAALCAGFSPTIEILIFFRALQALGAAIIFVTAASLASETFPKQAQARAVSIYSGITGLGLMLGPFLGGVLIELLDWRWVFWINLPLILIGIGCTSFSLKTDLPKFHRLPLDGLGLLLLIVGLGSLAYGIIAIADKGWSSPWALSPFCSGVLALLLLAVRERSTSAPLLQLGLLKQKLLLLALFSCSLAGVASFVSMFFDPFYLRIVHELPPLSIGLLIALIPATQVLISFLYTQILRWSSVSTLLLISISAGCAATLLHRFIDLKTPASFLCLPFMLLGINWGLSNAATLTAVNQSISNQKVAGLFGTVFTTWNFAGALLLSISSALFHIVKQRHPAMTLKADFLNGFHAVVTFNILFALLLLIGALWINRALKK